MRNGASLYSFLETTHHISNLTAGGGQAEQLVFVSVRNIIQTFKDCGFSCRCLISYEAGRQVYDRRHVFEQSEIRELRYAMGNTSEIASSVNFHIFGHPVGQIHAHSRSSMTLSNLPCPMSWSF